MNKTIKTQRAPSRTLQTCSGNVQASVNSMYIPKHIYIKRLLNSLIYNPTFANQLNTILTGKTLNPDAIDYSSNDEYLDKIILKTFP